MRPRIRDGSCGGGCEPVRLGPTAEPAARIDGEARSRNRTVSVNPIGRPFAGRTEARIGRARLCQEFHTLASISRLAALRDPGTGLARDDAKEPTRCKPSAELPSIHERLCASNALLATEFDQLIFARIPSVTCWLVAWRTATRRGVCCQAVDRANVGMIAVNPRHSSVQVVRLDSGASQQSRRTCGAAAGTDITIRRAEVRPSGPRRCRRLPHDSSTGLARRSRPTRRGR